MPKHTTPMSQPMTIPAELRVLSEQIYQYQKGVRKMVLYTFHQRYEAIAVEKLKARQIDYVIQPVGNERINLFFGRKECMDAIRILVKRPLCELTPEEDFILGALLGYDISGQCLRFCKRKSGEENRCAYCAHAQ